MLSEVRTGPVLSSDGAVNVARAGRFGELLTNDAVGKYYQAAVDGRLFMASMQATAVTGTALTATAVTFTLWNPPSSNVNLSVVSGNVNVGVLQTTTGNIPTYVWAANVNPAAAVPATNTEIVVRSGLLGGATGRGIVFSATTLPAVPIIIRLFPLATACTATTQLAEVALAAVDHVDGAIVIAPNTAVTIQGIATTTQISAFIGMTWIEVPI